MKNRLLLYMAVAGLLSALSLQVSAASEFAFTYQGRLNDGANPANGSYDLRFALYNADGTPAVNPPITNLNVIASNGLFTTTLDFKTYYFPVGGTLAIAVRTNGAEAFAELNPRQLFTPAPTALYASRVAFHSVGNLELGYDSVRTDNIVDRAIFTRHIDLSATWPGRLEAHSVDGYEIGIETILRDNISANAIYSNHISPNAIYSNHISPNAISSNHISSNAIFSAQIADNAIMAEDLNETVLSNTFWRLDGNRGTSPGAHFLGTTDNQALEIRVKGARALSLQPDPRPENAPNLIGGYSGNAISTNGVGSSVIAGGGYAGGPNRIQDNSSGSFIGAGSANVIQSNVNDSAIIGGYGNAVGAWDAVIGGGLYNANRGLAAFIGGGRDNLVLGEHAAILGGRAQTNAAAGGTIGGGIGNNVTELGADGVIAGGAGNHVSGRGASIPGGYANSADADISLAAGYRAKANHAGTFVWADSTDADFSSTSANQFLVRAKGGIGINTPYTAPETVAVAGQISVFSSGGFASPQVLLQQSNPADWGRFRLQSSGGSWDIALGPAAQPVLNFYDGTSSILALSSTNVAVNRTAQFPTVMEPKLNLWSDRFVIGMQDFSMYFRCNDSDPTDGFIWYKGGVHSNAYADAGGGTELMHLDSSGLWVKGTFLSGSDRNSKENFSPVDALAVLDKVAALPLSEWNYKQDAATRHLGPMAQDFYAAFGVGPDDKHIATVDADGVALAAIQGLNQKLEEKNAALERKVAELEALVNQLAARVSRTSP